MEQELHLLRIDRSEARVNKTHEQDVAFAEVQEAGNAA